MTDQIQETYDDVRDLLQTASWEVMDEDARDDVMKKVVVPRWGKTTADGVILKGTAWAKMLGTTVDTVGQRFRRIQAAKQGKPSVPAEPSKAVRDGVRSAKSSLKKHPELWDDDLLEAAEKALKRKEAVKAEVARIEQKVCEIVGDLEKLVEILTDEEDEEGFVVRVTDFDDDFILSNANLIIEHAEVLVKLEEDEA